MQIHPAGTGKARDEHPDGKKGAKFRTDTESSIAREEGLDFVRDLILLGGDILIAFLDDSRREDGGATLSVGGAARSVLGRRRRHGRKSKIANGRCGQIDRMVCSARSAPGLSCDGATARDARASRP